MDIALLLVVNCKLDIIIDRTPCNYISSFIQCANISTIDKSDYRRGKTSFQ